MKYDSRREFDTRVKRVVLGKPDCLVQRLIGMPSSHDKSMFRDITKVELLQVRFVHSVVPHLRIHSPSEEIQASALCHRRADTRAPLSGTLGLGDKEHTGRASRQLGNF